MCERMHDVQKEYKYNPTDSGSLSSGLLFSTSLFFTTHTHVLVCLTFHCSALLETHQRTSLGVPVASCFCGLRPVGEPCGFFWIELPLLVHVWWLPSGLDCSCGFVCGVFYWTMKIGLASKELFLNKSISAVLITFICCYLWWVVG